MLCLPASCLYNWSLYGCRAGMWKKLNPPGAESSPYISKFSFSWGWRVSVCGLTVLTPCSLVGGWKCFKGTYRH
jgi:hypothetical protein